MCCFEPPCIHPPPSLSVFVVVVFVSLLDAVSVEVLASLLLPASLLPPASFPVPPVSSLWLASHTFLQGSSGLTTQVMLESAQGSVSVHGTAPVAMHCPSVQTLQEPHSSSFVQPVSGSWQVVVQPSDTQV